MPSNGTPQKKNAAKKTVPVTRTAKSTTAKKTSTPPSKTAPQKTQANPTGPTARGQAEASPRQNDMSAIERFMYNRRKHRQLIALKTASYLLVLGFLTSVTLAIWQLTNSSMFAGVYVGLAALCAPSIAVCVVIYNRCKDERDNNN